MTSSSLEGESYFQVNNLHYPEHINKIADPILIQFERMMKSYVIFNMSFLILGSIEFLLIAFLLHFLLNLPSLLQVLHWYS